jgi:hypothetical protein
MDTVTLGQKTTLSFPKGTEIPIDLFLLGKREESGERYSVPHLVRTRSTATLMIDRKLAATQKLAIKNAPKKASVLDALIEIPEDTKMTRADLTKLLSEKTKLPRSSVSPWISTMLDLNVLVAVNT